MMVQLPWILYWQTIFCSCGLLTAHLPRPGKHTLTPHTEEGGVQTQVTKGFLPHILFVTSNIAALTSTALLYLTVYLFLSSLFALLSSWKHWDVVMITHREKQAWYSASGPYSKPGHLDCKVYEPQSTELATEPAVKGNTEVRGSVSCLWSSLESEPGHQEETEQKQNMLDFN